jgi:hypothetical protein
VCRVVSSTSLPSAGPAPRDARRRLPSRGARGPHSPPCPGTTRREDCPPAPLAARRWSLAPRYLACVATFVVSLTGSRSGRSSPLTPGPWVIRSPSPELVHGDRGLAPVPELPLWRHAPLAAPGGVLGTRPLASRTAAFRPRETVGVPLPTALRATLLATTIPLSGLHPAACLLVPSRFVHPGLGWHVACTTALLARHASGGTCALALTPRVATTSVMGFHPMPRSRAYLGATSAGFGVISHGGTVAAALQVLVTRRQLRQTQP